MGFKLVNYVYTQIKGTSPTEQSILAYLAFRANDQKRFCYPSVDKIEQETHFGRSTIRLALNTLLDKKLLSWITGGRQPGRHGISYANSYSFSFADDALLAKHDDNPLRPVDNLSDEVPETPSEALPEAKSWPMQGSGAGLCRGQELTPNIINNKNINENKIRSAVCELGRAWSVTAAGRTNLDVRPPKKDQHRTESLLNTSIMFCGGIQKVSYKEFMNALLTKDQKQGWKVFEKFRLDVQFRKIPEGANLAEILIARYRELPDKPVS